MKAKLATPEERRAKKLERRAIQRIANVGRAEKMHTARLAALRPSQEMNTDLPAYHVGCSGWFYWHWRGFLHGFNKEKPHPLFRLDAMRGRAGDGE